MTLRQLLATAACALALAIPAHAAPVAAHPPAVRAARDPGASIDALTRKVAGLPRDRRAAVVRDLEAVGPSALDALLARLAKDSAAMARLRAANPDAAGAFDAALVEAVGALRSPRALPALVAVFEGPTDDRRLVRASADGLGKLCDSGGFDVLARHAATLDRREQAAEAGLGLCRTGRSATLLAARLGEAHDPATVKALADGLGQVGSSWAWEAMGPANAATGARVRRTCADALVAAYARTEGPARESLGQALLMVDDPSTAAALRVRPELAPLAPAWERAHR